MKLRIICLLFMAVFAQSSVRAAAPSDTELKAQLERYKTLGSWRARFLFESRSPSLGHGTASPGELLFGAPNGLKINFREPERRDLVTNGTEAWLLLQRQGQPLVRHYRSLKGTAVTAYLLFARGTSVKTLRSLFTMDLSQVEDLSVLTLTPRKTGEVRKIALSFKSALGAPFRLEIEDRLGTTSSLTIASSEKLPQDPSPNEFKPAIPASAHIEEL